VRASRLERDAAVRERCPVVASAIGHIGHPQIRNRTTIGGNVAHADPSSELPGILACLDGTVSLTSRRGTREVGWDDFFQGVFSTCREPDELLTAVTFPAPEGWTFAYDEVAVRHGDYPLAGVTVGVADRPVRLGEVEEAAIGRPMDASTATELGRRARASVPASSDAHASAEYRQHVVGSLTTRLLQAVAS
jgi:carbon-monoxide dehydrogenase medium subunit